MTERIDQALHLLREAALPPRAADIESAVMARIDAVTRAREARPSLGVGLGAAALAAIIGMATANVAPMDDSPPLQLSVFSADAAFGPASLLATEG